MKKKLLIIMIGSLFCGCIYPASRSALLPGAQKKFEVEALVHAGVTIADIKHLLITLNIARSLPVDFQASLASLPSAGKEIFFQILKEYISDHDLPALASLNHQYREIVRASANALQDFDYDSPESIAKFEEIAKKRSSDLGEIKKKWQESYSFFTDLYYKLYYQAAIELGQEVVKGLPKPSDD